jgi:hypothetical protein
MVHTGATRALSKNRYTIRVPAEGWNVVTYPSQCCQLVFQAIVARTRGVSSAQKPWEEFITCIYYLNTLRFATVK